MSFFERLKRRQNRKRALIFGPATSEPLVAGLMEDEAFARAYRHAESVIREYSGVSLSVNRAEINDPAQRFELNFHLEVAAQLAVCRALQEDGHAFEAIAAMSLGELAAAYACGALSFDDVARVGCAMAPAVIDARGGDLVVAKASAKVCASLLDGGSAELIIQWPATSVWAVTDDFMDDFVSRLERAQIGLIKLGFRCMPHTADVNVQEMRSALHWLKPGTPRIPYYSCLTGGPVNRPVDADFWVTMCSEVVRFNEMHQALQRDGFHSLVQVGSVLLESEVFRDVSGRERPQLTRATDLLTNAFSAA